MSLIMREAGVMLIIKDGLILGVSRRNSPDIFGLPGGKCDPNETMLQAAIRETFEETNIVVKECSLLYCRGEAPEKEYGEWFQCACYYSSKWEGEPIANEEGFVIEWLTEEEITFSRSAFGDYNKKTLDIFKVKFPNIELK